MWHQLLHCLHCPPSIHSYSTQPHWETTLAGSSWAGSPYGYKKHQKGFNLKIPHWSNSWFLSPFGWWADLQIMLEDAWLTQPWGDMFSSTTTTTLNAASVHRPTIKGKDGVSPFLFPYEEHSRQTTPHHTSLKRISVCMPNKSHLKHQRWTLHSLQIKRVDSLRSTAGKMRGGETIHCYHPLPTCCHGG